MAGPLDLATWNVLSSEVTRCVSFSLHVPYCINVCPPETVMRVLDEFKSVGMPSWFISECGDMFIGCERYVIPFRAYIDLACQLLCALRRFDRQLH